jgi:SAM-dependent methyltransferase
MRQRPDIELTAVDVKVRPDALIPVVSYDGVTLPFEDGAFDCVLLVDVVHHAWEPAHLLTEARRVCRERVILKDHLADAFGAHAVLSFMDWVSNARHGIAMPYTYWTQKEWAELFAVTGLSVERWRTRLHLYPRPLSLVFDASLQFVASLKAELRA